MKTTNVWAEIFWYDRHKKLTYPSVIQAIVPGRFNCKKKINMNLLVKNFIRISNDSERKYSKNLQQYQ